MFKLLCDLVALLLLLIVGFFFALTCAALSVFFLLFTSVCVIGVVLGTVLKALWLKVTVQWKKIRQRIV